MKHDTNIQIHTNDTNNIRMGAFALPKPSGRRRAIRMQGFTLLLSLVVVSILMVVGLGVYDIIFRGIGLSISGRESQKAFYAADTGVECVLYWDLKTPVNPSYYGHFATSSESVFPGAGSSILCNNTDISSFWDVVSDSDSATTTISLPFSNGACATIFIFKNPSSPRTVAESHGSNLECDSSTGDPRRVERTLRVNY